MNIMENIELYGIGSCIQGFPSQQIERESRGIIAGLLAAYIDRLKTRDLCGEQIESKNGYHCQPGAGGDFFIGEVTRSRPPPRR